MSTCLPLYRKALLLEATASADTLLRSVMMSSVMPSLKYSCSESPLMLANGSTQIEKRLDSLEEGDAAAEVPPAFADCAAVERAIIAANALRHSSAEGLAGSAFQSSRSVGWIARTSIGNRAWSKRTGTSRPRPASSRASPRTQRDATEVGVHTTSTDLAACNSSSISSLYSRPGLISGSHHTDQPLASIAATSGTTRALSARA